MEYIYKARKYKVFTPDKEPAQYRGDEIRSMTGQWRYRGGETVGFPYFMREE